MILPGIDRTLCTACGECVLACPEKAVVLPDYHGPLVDRQRCTYCGLCEDVCPVGAVSIPVWIHVAAGIPKGSPHDQA
ncbi:MAG: ATP-binding protein [Anaerolineae bacterium]